MPKNIIKNIDNKILELDKLSFESSDTCYYCNKEYSRKDNLKRHVNYNCKKRNLLLSEKNQCLNEENNNDDDDNDNDNNMDDINSVNSDNDDNIINNDTINDISKLKQDIIELKNYIKEINKSKKV